MQNTQGDLSSQLYPSAERCFKNGLSSSLVSQLKSAGAGPLGANHGYNDKAQPFYLFEKFLLGLADTTQCA